ncbi:ABC transporter ATP-binding protein, partial [Pseudomonas stutzeri]|nr:ABC transporter ATP-binding protein [Stutzerimonas stutzeri]
QMMESLLHHERVSYEQARTRAIDLLAWTGISDARVRMSMYPNQLSGGLRQRVMIAMSLMCSPPVLIADEPTTALDVTTQLKILDLLGNVQKEFGTAVLLITHDLGVVAKVADRVAVMYGGRIVETGPARDVLQAPRHPYTQALLECLPQSRDGQPLKVIPGSIPIFNSASHGCGFASRCTQADALCDDDERLEEQFASGARCVRPIRYSPLKAGGGGDNYA